MHGHLIVKLKKKKKKLLETWNLPNADTRAQETGPIIVFAVCPVLLRVNVMRLCGHAACMVENLKSTSLGINVHELQETKNEWSYASAPLYTLVLWTGMILLFFI